MDRIRFSFVLEEGWELTPAEVSADPQARFIPAAWGALGATEPRDIEHPLFIRYGTPGQDIEHRGPDNYVEIASDSTLEDIALLTADGAPFAISHGGWGGDGLWVEPMLSVWELLNSGLTLHGAWTLSRDLGIELRQLRYRTHRALAANWRDSDDSRTVPMELLSLIKSRDEWLRRHFDFVFGLDGTAGTKLLKAAGYRKVVADPEALWRDIESHAN